MFHLRVTLDQSFEGDLVILRVDGREILRSTVKGREKVLAPIRLPEPRRFSLEVEVPAKGVFGTHGIAPSKNLDIAVRLEPTGVLLFQIQPGSGGNAAGA